MIFQLTRTRVLFTIFVFWAIFIALSITRFNHFQILNIIGFLFLALIPGILTVFSLKLKSVPFWALLSLSVAFSLLELMVVGLIGNTLLPRLNVAEPLNRTALLIEISILLSILFFIVWKRLLDWKYDLGTEIYKFFSSRIDILLSFFPVLFVVQSAIGAFSLNNGGSGLWTLTMLGEIGIYSLILYLYSKKLNENTIPTALFFIGLALLLMTSLRGWYITGHDIQIEYKVFELTKNAGLWNMNFYRDAYYACLSITILPTIFFNILKVSDPFIYKFFFQFFFAFCPVLAYLISRHWTSRQISFLSGFYFISFPTFFVDMAFLVRQEIAFLFYGLMIYFIFNSKLDLKMRRYLFVILGIGIILSHYSTTYTILLIFTLAVISRLILMRFFNSIKNRWSLLKNFQPSLFSNTKNIGNKTKITFIMIFTLMLASFLWTSIITNTGGNITKVLAETMRAIGDGFTENTRSTDAVNLLSFRTPSQQEELELYIKKVLNPIRTIAPVGTYFEESTYSQYKFFALPDEQLPLTKFGNFIQKSGVNFVPLVTVFGRILAKLMEILVPLGMLYILLYNSVFKYIDDEFYLIALYSLVFIFLIILIPVLSTEYGIYRAMQQSMYLLAIPMVMGGLLIENWIKKIIYPIYSKIKGSSILNFVFSKDVSLFSITIALLFFLYSTSFILQIFGKNSAVLFLSNTGRYYDNYLIKTPEILAVNWLDTVTDENIASISGVKIRIQTDKYSQRKLASLSSLDAYNEIYPGVIRKDAYVFLGQATTQKQRATLVYGGDQITYTYPVQFLDRNKNLIYVNGSAKIYK